MGTCSSSSRASNSIQSQIDALRVELAKPFEPHGQKGWQQQLDADTKRKAKIERKINGLQKQLKAGQKTETQKKQEKEKPTTSEFKWQRAGEGWYVGKGGFEIRENDNGGFDVVKVKGGSEKKIKTFSKLSQARKYNPND